MDPTTNSLNLCFLDLIDLTEPEKKSIYQILTKTNTNVHIAPLKPVDEDITDENGLATSKLEDDALRNDGELAQDGLGSAGFYLPEEAAFPSSRYVMNYQPAFLMPNTNVYYPSHMMFMPQVCHAATVHSVFMNHHLAYSAATIHTYESINEEQTTPSFQNGEVSVDECSQSNQTVSSNPASPSTTVVHWPELKPSRYVADTLKKAEAMPVTENKPQQSVIATPSHAVSPISSGPVAPHHTSTPVDAIPASTIPEAENQQIEEPKPAVEPTKKSWASLFADKQKTSQNNEQTPNSAHTPTKKRVAFDQEKMPALMAELRLTLKEPFRTHADNPNLHRLGDFLSKYKPDHRSTSLQPRGLINKSNYCYIHAILQALLACPPVYNLLAGLANNMPQPPMHKLRVTPIIDGLTRFVKQFRHLSSAAIINRRSAKKNNKKKTTDEPQQEGSSVTCEAPIEVVWMTKLLNGTRSDTFTIEGRQEDAEEFLGCLLNELNDEMLELIKLKGLSDINKSHASPLPSQNNNGSDDEWQVMGPKNKSSVTRRANVERTPITDIFSGLLRSRIHRSGDQPTDNIQPFFTLQLRTEESEDVAGTLEHFVCKHQLEGVMSNKTNEKVEAYQQTTIEELPMVLVLHLKCFDYSSDGCSKIMKTIEYPVDLKIEQKVLSSSYNAKERQYKLFAVVYHEGKEATKGHYITDAYHVGYGSWLRYDDASVTEVTEQSVLKPTGTRVPYLLFYRRSDTLSSNRRRSD